MSSKKILIIGTGGLIGSSIYKKLKDNNYNIIGVDYPEIDVTSISSINNFISKMNISNQTSSEVVYVVVVVWWIAHYT